MSQHPFPAICALIVSLALCAPTAQARQSQEPGSPPSRPRITRVDQIRKDQLRAPRALAERGFAFYEFTVTPAATILVNLYDEGRSLQGSVLVQEDMTTGTFTATMRPAGAAESWLRVERTIDKGARVFSVTDSARRSVRVRVEGAVVQTSDTIFRATAVKVEDAAMQRELNFAALKSGQTRELDEILDGAFFTTPNQQTLKCVLEHIDLMFAEVIGQERRAAGPLLPVRAAVACYVQCARIGTIIPIYWCDGGSTNNCSCSAGDGIFVISHPNCGYFSCSIPCRDFRNSQLETPAEV